MNYKEQIEFNNECIEIYRDWNIEKQYNQKIFMLVRENIEMYSQLNKLERFKKRKPIQTIQKEKEKLIWINSKVTSMYKLPYYKESELSEEDIDREIALWFDLYKNNY